MPGSKKDLLNRFFFHLGLAISAALGGFLMRLIVTGFFGRISSIYFPFYLAIMLIAIVGGFWTGLLATAISLLMVVYWLLPPIGKFAIETPIDAVSVYLFWGIGTFTSGMAELYRRNRKKAAAYDKEMALRESEQKFSAVFHKAPVAMALTIYPEGKVYDVNQSWLNLTGFSRKEEVIGKISVELGLMLKAETRDLLMDKFQKSGCVRNAEVIASTRAGEERALLVSLHTLEIGGRKFILSMSIDITERKRAEKALVDRTVQLERTNRELAAFKAELDLHSHAQLRPAGTPPNSDDP